MTTSPPSSRSRSGGAISFRLLWALPLLLSPLLLYNVALTGCRFLGPHEQAQRRVRIGMTAVEVVEVAKGHGSVAVTRAGETTLLRPDDAGDGEDLGAVAFAGASSLYLEWQRPVWPWPPSWRGGFSVLLDDKGRVLRIGDCVEEHLPDTEAR